jgi:class 3 adenylate cyclase
MHCSACGHENRTDAHFCGHCGTAFATACAACGQSNAPGNAFCDACGRELRDSTNTSTAPADPQPKSYTPAHLTNKILSSHAAIEGERKQVTVLFCDMANSTELTRQVGPEQMHDILNALFALAMAEVHGVEGTVNQFLGDGFMALFGAPLAHEDHVRRALMCALAIQQRLQEASSQGDAKGSANLLGRVRLRMGLNTGPVVIGRIGDNLRMDYTAIGDTTNIAARLQGLAQPGTVYVSASVQAVGLHHFEFEALGTRALKGIENPMAVFQLVRARSALGGETPLTGLGIAAPLIGRDFELQVAKQALGDLREGRGGLLLISGEAGSGKSRLMAEVRKLPGGESLRWLEGRALSFGRHLSYWPFIEVVKRCFEISEDDSEVLSFGKLRNGLLMMFGLRGADLLPYLATMLALPVGVELAERVKHLDGLGLKRQVFLCMRQLFEHLAQGQALVLVLEDWHWADQSSVELAEHLLPLVQASPLLVCFVTRPEPGDIVEQVRKAAEELGGAPLHEVALSPLSASQSEVLLGKLVGQQVLPASLREQILSRAEGNPFFVEEIVRSLVSQRVLVPRRDGAGWQLGKAVDQVQLPDTLQGLIVARIDRLDDEIKQALKLASVIGRSFFDRVLEAISDARHALPEQLKSLEGLELIRQKLNAPEPEHIFKHALVQEAAYGSMLEDSRRGIHRRVAQAIELLFADRLDEFSSLLAHHFTCAEDWDQAQVWLFRAGDLAGRMAADTEALALLRQAELAYLKVYGDRLVPLERTALQRKIGSALYGTGKYEEGHVQMRQALGHMGVNYPDSRWGTRRAILKYLGAHLWRRLRRQVGLPVKRDMELAMAMEISTIAHFMAWMDYFLDKERLLLDSLLELDAGERSQHGTAEARGLSSLGFATMTFNLRKISRRYNAQAALAAQRSGQPPAIVLSFFSQGFLDFYEGNWDACEAHMGKAEAGYRELGDIHRWGSAALMLCWLLVPRGQLARTHALSSEVVRAGDHTADPQVTSWGLQNLGTTLTAQGNLEEAEAALRRGCEIAERVGAWDNLLHQKSLLAKCLLLQGRMADAEAMIDDSFRIKKLRKQKLPFDCIELFAASAVVRVAKAERADASARPAAMLTARAACKTAIECARLMPLWLPEALRTQGNLSWLEGKAIDARKHWHESLIVAERSAFPIERGLTLMDQGLRLGDAALLTDAAQLFREAGALKYLAMAQPDDPGVLKAVAVAAEPASVA